MRSKPKLLLALGLAVATSATAQSLPDAVRQAQVWAATCSTCHGPDGRSAHSAVPSLAGRDATELHQTLLSFKNGQRPATVMHQHAKGYSDAELRSIAAWFARQPSR